MEPLHAPWRITYLLGPKPVPGTAELFSQIAQSSDDVGNLVIVRDKTCFALLNRYPYTGGHIMVLPYKRVPDFNGLTEQELCDLMVLTRRCQNALTDVMHPHGFNIGVNVGSAAGAGIAEHLHIHIVPRWMGDTNFMPVIGGTTVVPEALADIAAKLRTALQTSQRGT
jgi:ATP adenylyltransferase